MEAIITEDIPSTKAAVQPTDAYIPNRNEDQEQPSGSMQPSVNQATVEYVQSTNTYTLEFPVLLLFISWNLSATVFQNQVIYQSCILNYNTTTCDLLTNDMIPDDLVVIIMYSFTIPYLIRFALVFGRMWS